MVDFCLLDLVFHVGIFPFQVHCGQLNIKHHVTQLAQSEILKHRDQGNRHKNPGPRILFRNTYVINISRNKSCDFTRSRMLLVQYAPTPGWSLSYICSTSSLYFSIISKLIQASWIFSTFFTGDLNSALNKRWTYVVTPLPC